MSSPARKASENGELSSFNYPTFGQKTGIQTSGEATNKRECPRVGAVRIKRSSVICHSSDASGLKDMMTRTKNTESVLKKWFVQLVRWEYTSKSQRSGCWVISQLRARRTCLRTTGTRQSHRSVLNMSCVVGKHAQRTHTFRDWNVTESGTPMIFLVEFEFRKLGSQLKDG